MLSLGFVSAGTGPKSSEILSLPTASYTTGLYSLLWRDNRLPTADVVLYQMSNRDGKKLKAKRNVQYKVILIS
jgi:hypothetical protein